jgi:Zn-dependent protease with chaperone function
LVDIVSELLLATLRSVFFSAHLLLTWVGLHDGQRAEYLADELAAQAGGSAATTDLLDTLLDSEPAVMLIKQGARSGQGVASWQASTAQARTQRTQVLPGLRQLSTRDDASLFATHPPDGLRAKMIEFRPTTTPRVHLNETDSSRIDQELATQYETTRQELAAT